MRRRYLTIKIPDFQAFLSSNSKPATVCAQGRAEVSAGLWLRDSNRPYPPAGRPLRKCHWPGYPPDYRETLAIEQKLAEDPLARERWMQRQLELDPTDGGREELLGVVVGSGVEDEDV